MTENHIVKENDAIKKLALLAAEVRGKGAEGADRRFARCASPAACALSVILRDGICRKVAFFC